MLSKLPPRNAGAPVTAKKRKRFQGRKERRPSKENVHRTIFGKRAGKGGAGLGGSQGMRVNGSEDIRRGAV